MAAENNKISLHLPPYYFKLKPIEFMSARIKNEVASNNTIFQMVEVNNPYFKNITITSIDNWTTCIAKIHCEQRKLNDTDEIFGPLLISIEGNASSDSNTSSEIQS